MLAPDGKRFPWGKIVNVHEINDIQIVEHEPKYDNVGKFHPYVAGKDTCMSAQSLDEAIIIAISFKYKATSAATYVCKMIGVPTT